MDPMLIIMVIGVWIKFVEAWHDGERQTSILHHKKFGPAVDDPTSFRYGRNNQGRVRPHNGVRFGWQNPIRVAPTLRPLHINPTQSTTEYYQEQFTSINQPNPYYPPSRETTSTEMYQDPLLAEGSNQMNQYYTKGEPTFDGVITDSNSLYETFLVDKPNAQPQIGRQRCPNGSSWDKENGKCTRLGSSCGENMAFYLDPTDREHGQCDCIQFASRPLVYHPESRKCYFVFQQAFCKPSEWLILDTRAKSQPICSNNPCLTWTKTNVDPSWNWRRNDLALDRNGTVALLNEKLCTVLGLPCREEGKKQLFKNLVPESISSRSISLVFEGMELVCRKDDGRNIQHNSLQESNNDLVLVCKHGLFNRWKQDGHCINI